MTKRLTTEQLEAIHKRTEMATAGPWTRDYDSKDGEFFIVETWVSAHQEADADFIANARTDIPALLALIDELYAENSRLCPIGDLDTITTLQTEIAYRDEIIAARDTEVERFRQALESIANSDGWLIEPAPLCTVVEAYDKCVIIATEAIRNDNE